MIKPWKNSAAKYSADSGLTLTTRWTVKIQCCDKLSAAKVFIV